MKILTVVSNGIVRPSLACLMTIRMVLLIKGIWLSLLCVALIIFATR